MTNKKEQPSLDALQALSKAAVAITSQLSLSKALQEIVDAARVLAGARYAALGVPDAEGNLVEFVTSGMRPDVEMSIPHRPQGLGLLGAIIKERRTIRIPRIQDDPRSVGFPPGHPVMESFLGVPIMTPKETLGNLYLTEKIDAGEFSQADEELLEVFAHHAAIAITNARLYEANIERRKESEARNQELAALNAVARVTSQHMDLDEMLDKTLEQVMVLTGMEAGEIFILDEASGEMVLTFHRGLHPEAFHSISRFRPGEGFVGFVAQTGAAIDANLGARQGSANVPYWREAVREAGFQSLVYTPLASKQKVVGVMGLASKQQRRFSSRSLNLLEAIGHQVGMAIENARLYSRIGQLAVVEERARIGMDLHDGVIQSIYAVGLTLESARLLLSEDTEDTGYLLAQAIDSLNDIIRDIRNFILDLRPQRFEGNVEQGLTRLVREFQANAMVPVHMSIPSSAILGLPPAVARTIFLSTQESLANVARHARASQVTLQIERTGDQVILTIRDDGRGFDVSHQTQTVGHGLANMRARAEDLGGLFEVQSAPGEGTTICLKLPAR